MMMTVKKLHTNSTIVDEDTTTSVSGYTCRILTETGSDNDSSRDTLSSDNNISSISSSRSSSSSRIVESNVAPVVVVDSFDLAVNTIMDTLLLPFCYDVSYNFFSIRKFLSSNETYYNDIETSNSVNYDKEIDDYNDGDTIVNKEYNCGKSNARRYEMYVPCFYDMQSWLQNICDDCNNNTSDDGINQRQIESYEDKANANSEVNNVPQNEQKSQSFYGTNIPYNIDTNVTSTFNMINDNTVTVGMESTVKDIHEPRKRRQKSNQKRGGIKNNVTVKSDTMVNAYRNNMKGLQTNQTKQEEVSSIVCNCPTCTMNQKNNGNNTIMSSILFSRPVSAALQTAVDEQNHNGSISPSECSFCSLSVVLLSLMLSSTSASSVSSTTISSSDGSSKSLDTVATENCNSNASANNTKNKRNKNVGNDQQNVTGCEQVVVQVPTSRRPSLVGSEVSGNCSSCSLGTICSDHSENICKNNNTNHVKDDDDSSGSNVGIVNYEYIQVLDDDVSLDNTDVKDWTRIAASSPLTFSHSNDINDGCDSSDNEPVEDNSYVFLLKTFYDYYSNYAVNYGVVSIRWWVVVTICIELFLLGGILIPQHVTQTM